MGLIMTPRNVAGKCETPSSGMVDHWPMMVEGAEVGNWVLKAVDIMVMTLLKKTSVRQLNFVPEYRKYIRLESQGTNPNLH